MRGTIKFALRFIVRATRPLKRKYCRCMGLRTAYFGFIDRVLILRVHTRPQL